LFGKEWQKLSKKNKDKTLGVNLRVLRLGGFRESPILLTESVNNNTTVFDDDQAFSIKQDDFFRIDARFYYTINKKGRSSTLSLDIQNLSSMENAAFSYFDTRQQQVIVKNQLGIIPIINYRVSF
ncbi:MAG: TonB-dependent receptor, partial [Bacteroidota bacterium]